MLPWAQTDNQRQGSIMPQTTSIVSQALSLRRHVTKPSVHSKKGIVVSQNRIASEVGARVLAAGGHAVDAAVATAMTLGVVEPWMSGIGGVGLMLVRDAKTGKTTAFDFGAISPQALNPKDYRVVGGTDGNLFGWAAVKGNRNTVGATAVCTPSQPLGLSTAHKRFGRKKWADLLAPAIAEAESGLVVDWYAMLNITSAMGDLALDPGASKRFLRNGLPPQPSVATLASGVVRLPMPDLAKTLTNLARNGAEAMYRGPLAKAIVADVQALGGCLSEADLAGYSVRTIEDLQQIPYGRYTIHVVPELNGGPTLAMAFAELTRIRKRAETKPNGKTFAAYAAALRHAWQYRMQHLGDAGEKTAPTCTTHLSVVDRDGNMVTLTQTLLSLFGSRVVLPKTGILMNNGINWFDPTGGPNGIAPGRRALANYAPAIMTSDTETVAIGGCGGRKIIPAVFQLLALQADFGMDLNTAFHQPRVDVSGLGPVAVDRRLGDKALAIIGDAFDTVTCEPVPYPFPFTIASAVRRVKGINEGATEPEQPWSEAVSEDDVAG
jgi:gamma-glutamyltranspeptidase / glutathione hydrolase